MASIDSGVDTGNDSNDSFAQDKNLTVQIEQSQSKVPPKTFLPIPLFQMANDSNKDDSVRNEDTRNLEFQIQLNQPRSSVSESMITFDKDRMKLFTRTPSYSVTDFGIRVLKEESSPIDLTEISLDVSSIYQNSPLITKMRSLQGNHAMKTKRFMMKNRGDRQWMKIITANNENRLRVAALLNNVEKVERLLGEGTSPNCPDHQYRTPLHLAACNGYTDVVRLLLQYGADPNRIDLIGNTPLHLAVCTNHIDVVTLLLKAGTDATLNNRIGRSPLQLAQSKLRLIKRSQDFAYKHQVTAQVVEMLLMFMKRKRDSLETIDEDLLNSFQTRLQVSETQEQVENELQNLLDNLSSLSLANNNNNNDNNNSSSATVTQ